MPGRTALGVAIVAGLLLVAAGLVPVAIATRQKDDPRPQHKDRTMAEDPKQRDDTQSPVYFSPIHVCFSDNGLVAYVVNQTADSVSVLDVPARKVIAEIPVGPFPAHAALSADGRSLLVTNHHGAAVDVIDLDSRRVVRSITAGFEPYGVTVSADGSRVYVANSLSDTVSLVDAESGQTQCEIPVGRNPRFVSEIPGSDLAVVACGLGRCISIIDGATGRVVEERQLGEANLLRQIVCTSDGRWAFAAHVLSRDKIPTLQMERGFIHSNGFSVIDLQQPGHYATLLLDRLLVGAANPWGLALSADDRHLYVSLAGVHEIAIVDVAEVLSLVTATEPGELERLSQDVEILDRLGIMRRLDAGGIGPRGIALNGATGELWVANYFSDTVSVLDAESGGLIEVIPLGEFQEMTPWRTGEMLFNDARLCYQTWYSCASCHQEDATMDGVNWDLSNDGLGNAKNAKSMHDCCDTPPAMWTGVRTDMDAAVAAGQRFLGFLPDPDNHLALMAFIGTPRRAPNPYVDHDPEAVRRGKRVFRKAGCLTCHPAPLYTDLRKHSLGLVTETDLKSHFDTPSLRECYRTGPYLRDGRATTLEDIFTQFNPDDRHGRTSKFTEAEMDDLVSYLRSL